MKSREVNLLPEKKLKLLRIQRLNSWVTLVITGLSVVAVVSILGLLLGIGSLRSERDSVAKELTRKEAEVARLNGGKTQGERLEDKAGLIQRQLSTIRVILDAKEKIQFGRALERIGRIVPPEVSFGQASLDAGRTVTISGDARSYAAVGRFVEALKSDGTLINRPNSGPVSFFQEVSITSSNTNVLTGLVSYTITFKLSEETFHASR